MIGHVDAAGFYERLTRSLAEALTRIRMTHLVDELKAKADASIAAMRDAALRARDTHARAELMRHMLMTASKVKDRPAVDAVRFIVDHWLEAWDLARASWPHVDGNGGLCRAPFTRMRGAPTDAHDDAVRATCVRLELVFVAAGMPIADQMAWRSICAHGWWAHVRPPPPGKGRPDREGPDRPFWEHALLAGVPLVNRVGLSAAHRS